MTEDIVTRLLPFINDEMRIPAGLIMDTIEEVERLRAELEDADDDFYVLKTMFDKVRAEKAELLEAIRLTAEYYLPPALDNWEWWKAYSKYADPTDAQRMKDYCDKANEQVVRGE